MFPLSIHVCQDCGRYDFRALTPNHFNPFGQWCGGTQEEIRVVPEEWLTNLAQQDAEAHLTSLGGAA